MKKLDEQIVLLQEQNKAHIQALADHQSGLTLLTEALVLLEQNAQAARLERELSLSRQTSTQMEKMAVVQQLALLEQEMQQQDLRRADRADRRLPPEDYPADRTPSAA